MNALLILLMSFGLTQEGEALRRYALAWPCGVALTPEVAQEHLWSSRIAAEEYRVRPRTVLTVARHESCFEPNVATREPNGKLSCGAMTPQPIHDVCPQLSVLDQYRAGAAHLRRWLDIYGENYRLALLGYAGGFALVNACLRGPYFIVRNGVRWDLCNISYALEGR